MALLHRLTGGLRALLRRRDVERDLDDEVRAYLDTAIERNVAAGMTRAEAERSARAAIGSLEAVKDQTREVGWEFVVETTWRDVRYAARTLRRAPAFSTVAILTLALGIGANTAIFSVVNAVMMRPLPVERPEELISVAAVYRSGVDPVFSYSAYRHFASGGAQAMEAFAASSINRLAVTIDGAPEPVRLKRVSGNYFTALGVPAAAGRTLLPSDDRPPSGETVAVLSDAYWSSRFGRDPSAIGRRISLNAAAFTVVGVARQGFFGESVGDAPDIWTPLTAQPGAPAWLWTGHSTTWLTILGRVRPGVTLASARAALDPVYGRLREDIAAGMERPEFRQGVLDSRLRVADASGGSPRLRDFFSRPLQILMAIVGLVLVIACANVASLVLARSSVRRRDTAVCLAIGAGRSRLVRQLLAEAALLAGLGAIAGLLLAFWGTSALAGLAARSALSLSLDLAPDLRVLAFTMFVTAATAIVFGLLPALRAARVEVLSALKGSGSTQSAVRIPLGRTLVITQIAVSVILLVPAGLFVRSLLKLRDVEIGFDVDRVLLMQLTPLVDERPITPQERRDLYRRLLARAETVPGVRAASLSFTGVFNNGTWGNAITVEGFTPPPDTITRTFANAIAPRYFDVMGLPLVGGRPFSDSDVETAPPVAIVNRTFARRFFGGADPIGRRVGLGAPAKNMMTIVGVAEDAKYVEVREDNRAMLYVPFAQHDMTLRSLEVRTDVEPTTVAATLRRELTAVDPRVTIVGAAALSEQVDASIVIERLVAQLSAAFGLLALGLAAVGAYGLTAYVTAQRTVEIGIRMALGGDQRAARRLVARDIFVLVGTGVAIGLPIALVAGRLLAGQLYQTHPSDPIAIGAGLVTLCVAALIAGYIPARRAARVDPLVALRCE